MLRSHLSVLLSGSAIALGSALAACSASPIGASDTALSKAQSKAGPGGDLYQKECAACHGKKGEGLTNAPGVIGSGALPEYPRDASLSTNPALSNSQQQQAGDSSRPPGAPSRDPFRTAQDLYNYVSTKMPLPKSRAGSLKPEEYWAITNFMLIAHGSAVPEAGITADNAASVQIAPK
jgi:mono/diheme cytochrome c family protein